MHSTASSIPFDDVYDESVYQMTLHRVIHNIYQRSSATLLQYNGNKRRKFLWSCVPATLKEHMSFVTALSCEQRGGVESAAGLPADLGLMWVTRGLGRSTMHVMDVIVFALSLHSVTHWQRVSLSHKTENE